MARDAARPRAMPPAFGAALLAWYDDHRRDLPWRRTNDPYAIWLSEVMLQQTTVRTVEPRWRRFLELFPTVRALADASLDAVLAEWSGLGYYARARNLHAAAQRVRDDFGGALPAQFETLLALPGMGKYTAAAVASIAFGDRVAVLDANVERVLARLDAFAEDIRAPRAKAALWDRAQELLDLARPGDWNQAMMELGATVCLPRAPQCPACPVRRWCRARVEGDPERLPIKGAKEPLEDVREVAVVLRDRARVLILHRPPKGSFANMWELPRGVLAAGESIADGAVRIVRELTGLSLKPTAPMLRIRHVVMRRRIELFVVGGDWSGRFDGPIGPHDAADWIEPVQWLALPLSSTQKRVARYLAHHELPPNNRRARGTPGEASGDLFDG